LVTVEAPPIVPVQVTSARAVDVPAHAAARAMIKTNTLRIMIAPSLFFPLHPRSQFVQRRSTLLSFIASIISYIASIRRGVTERPATNRWSSSQNAF
jgi:hypothetical protein